MAQPIQTAAGEQLFDLQYQLDGDPRVCGGRILARSAHPRDILAAMDCFIARHRVKILSVRPARKRRRRTAAVNGAVYKRFVPSKWSSRTGARTDLSLEAATDPRVQRYCVVASGRWIAVVDMESARDALSLHPIRQDKLALMPFNIDIARREIEGKPVKMTIVWRRAA
jgi:hypothetical protein